MSPPSVPSFTMINPSSTASNSFIYRHQFLHHQFIRHQFCRCILLRDLHQFRSLYILGCGGTILRGDGALERYLAEVNFKDQAEGQGEAAAELSSRPGNHVVYYPNRLLSGLNPHEGMRLTRKPVAWIREAVGSNEADVIRMSVVDTAVYFVFLTTVLGILVLSGLVLLPVRLPVAVTAHGAMKANDTTSEGTFDDLGKSSSFYFTCR